MASGKLLKAGGAGALLCLFAAFTDRDQFFISYLSAYLFWFGIAVGRLGLLLLHFAHRRAWGDLIRPSLQAAARTIPLAGIVLSTDRAGRFIFTLGLPRRRVLRCHRPNRSI
jgi:hypothetical protein